MSHKRSIRKVLEEMGMSDRTGLDYFVYAFVGIPTAFLLFLMVSSYVDYRESIYDWGKDAYRVEAVCTYENYADWKNIPVCAGRLYKNGKPIDDTKAIKSMVAYARKHEE